MTEDRDKIINITYKGEVLIWLLIIMIIVGLFSIGLILKEKNDSNDYQVFLQDVDGLIIGSPVRLMGIEVGHVTKIKPTNDEVYVKFIITNPNISIPQGTNVTVEFSGMAGSKSLELYLPEENSYIESSTPVLSVLPPKRLHDALGLLNDMFKKLASIGYTASSFGTKLDSTGIKNTKTEAMSTTEIFKDFLQYTNNFIEESGQNAKDLQDSLKRLQNHDKQVQ